MFNGNEILNIQLRYNDALKIAYALAFAASEDGIKQKEYKEAYEILDRARMKAAANYRTWDDIANKANKANHCLWDEDGGADI